MPRIKQRFEDTVKEIVNPPNPGNVVCCGVIALALNPNAIMARIARKTYSIMNVEIFEEGLDPLEYVFNPKSGSLKDVKMCQNQYSIFVEKGSLVEVDQCTTRTFIILDNRKG
jgi:hypothetical protein